MFGTERATLIVLSIIYTHSILTEALEKGSSELETGIYSSSNSQTWPEDDVTPISAMTIHDTVSQHSINQHSLSKHGCSQHGGGGNDPISSTSYNITISASSWGPVSSTKYETEDTWTNKEAIAQQNVDKVASLVTSTLNSSSSISWETSDSIESWTSTGDSRASHNSLASKSTNDKESWAPAAEQGKQQTQEQKVCKKALFTSLVIIVILYMYI